MAGWMWSTKEFLDYDNYKSKISSIWDEIWDTISDTIGNAWDKIDLGNNYEIGDSDLDDETSVNVESYDYGEEENVQKAGKSDSSKKQTIKSFPKSVSFVEIPQLKEEKKSDNLWPLTWYSKSDLIWVINKYIEENLDDNTDILVTVEYEDDSSNPQKIILQTQPKSVWEKYSSDGASDLLNEIFNEIEWKEFENIEDSLDEDIVAEGSNNQVKNNEQSVKKTTSTRLTQEEQKDAEEIFDLLF